MIRINRSHFRIGYTANLKERKNSNWLELLMIDGDYLLSLKILIQSHGLFAASFDLLKKIIFKGIFSRLQVVVHNKKKLHYDIERLYWFDWMSFCRILVLKCSLDSHECRGIVNSIDDLCCCCCCFKWRVCTLCISTILISRPTFPIYYIKWSNCLCLEMVYIYQ